MQGGATGAVHQLSKAGEQVGVAGAASSDAVTPEPGWEREESN